MTRDDFMEDTVDVWEIPAERATRVGHPAPFPVELPARLIDLYTYRGDLVLDPFAGSGTTAVAALRSGRHYVGYDLDDTYIRLAEARVADERLRFSEEGPPRRVNLSAGPAPVPDDEDLQSLAVRQGLAAKDIAAQVIAAAGFIAIQKDQRQPGGVEVNFTARDGTGNLWLFDVAGGFTSYRGGLTRTDAIWKALGKGAILREVGNTPLVLLTTDPPGGAGAVALRQVTGPEKPIRAVIEMLTVPGLEALRALCESRDRQPDGKSP
jgi:site-specific DNA-methyltransferase (adenine-specific)